MSIAGSGAGHGGKKTNGNWRDGGAHGNGYNEADVTRTINKKIIALTGAKDTTDNLGTSVNDNLNRIAQNINKAPDGYHLSNHLNAFNGKATGVEVLYGDVSQKAIAAKLSKAIANALGIADRGAKDGSWLAIARGTGAGKKVLLIEWCFIDNKSDMQKLMANMDKAISAMLSVFGYSTTVQPPKPEVKPSTAQNSKPKVRQITVDGKWGADTTRRLQEVLGTPIDGVISGQDRRYITNILSARAGQGGSLVIKAMQRKLGVKADGYLGPNTFRALQKHYGTPVDGFISPVSNVVMAMQRALNSNKF